MSARATRIRALSTFMSKGSRPAQEDHVLASREKGIFAIADGFGGPGPGAAAAKTACEAVKSFLVKEAGDLEATLPFVIRSYFSLAGNVLFNALIHANRKVTALNKGRNVHERGGASVLAGFMDGDLLAIANVGACSVWLLRGGHSTELVVPRTYGKLVDPLASEVAPELRAPLMAVGMAEDLEPEIFEYRVRPGDWLVFQTDGLTEEVRGKLLDLKQQKLNPETAVQKATDILNRGAYQDNMASLLAIF